MQLIFVVIVIGVSVLTLFCLCLVAGKVYRSIELEKQRQLAQLNQYLRRLSAVVAALLQRVDEFDRDTKYMYEKVPEKQAKHIEILCRELVALADELKAIEQELKLQDVRIGKQRILNSLKIADVVARELDNLRRMSISDRSDLS